MLARAASAIGGAVGGVANAVSQAFGSGRGGGGSDDEAPPARRARAAAPPAAKAGMAKEMAELASPAPAEVSDRLYDVLLTQAADGSFALSPALLSWCGADADKVREAARQHGEARVATALVLFVLARDEAGRQEEWRAAADKARAFMARAGDFDVAALLGA